MPRLVGLALASCLLAAAPAALASPTEPPRHEDDGAINSGKEVHSHGQHGGQAGHLPPTQRNVRLVSRLDLQGVEDGRVSDVGALGDYAYLGAYAEPRCAKGGVHVVDISDPDSPRQVNFVHSRNDTYVSEGVQALHLSTPAYEGDLLVHNNEICGNENQNAVGGISLVDVTNPRVEGYLAEGVGDFTNPDGSTDTQAHEVHSAFAWQDGDRAFVVLVDDEEGEDVDILEITDPRNPTFVAEYDLNTFNVLQPDVNGQESFLHDMVVKEIDGQQIMLLSYWDGGYVRLNVDDPANAQFLGDTDFTNPDPEQPAFTPEGNGHQAEFSRDNRFFVGTDEDFSPYRGQFEITSGGNAGEYPAGEFGWTVPIASLPDKAMNGPTVFGGYGCPGSSVPPPPTGLPEGQEAILVVSRGPVQDPNESGSACFFSEKVETAQNAGYGGVIIANHHVGADAGGSPDAFACGSQGHAFTPTIPAICIGHRAMHLLFGATPDYTVPYPERGSAADMEPAVGASGEQVSATSQFDGWGYVHLFDAAGNEIDTYSIPEAQDEQYATGFGDLSVHEVATDPDRNLAYFSYYAGGFRVAKFGQDGIREVGRYIDADGNNFWGVEVLKHANGQKYVLASDRDSGLWIFQYTGR